MKYNTRVMIRYSALYWYDYDRTYRLL